MSIATFGHLIIEVTPHADNPAIMSVDIGCQTRLETISMTTNKDETVDQLAMRIRSMLRSLVNSEIRQTGAVEESKPKDKKKARTWDEQKASMTMVKNILTDAMQKTSETNNV